MLSVYLLPFLVVGSALMLSFWQTRHLERQTLITQLDEMQGLLQKQEKERDAALQELFRRFSEEGKLNKEKSQFQAQLGEYEKYAALTQLALGAAHEINNRLLGILSHLELELKTAPANERPEIEQCIEAARRISVNLHRLVSDTLAFLQHQPMLHCRILKNQVQPDLPSIRVDANQLSQVFMNLLLNAAQATPEGGRITVSADRSLRNDAINIRISDTGCGIPPDVLPHVFEPFFSTKRGKGTGLGLSISQTYVRSHSGEIQIESVPDHGTTVTITLPLLQPEAPASRESHSNQEVIIQ